MHRIVWTLAATMQGGGIALSVLHFHAKDPWLFVGLTSVLGGFSAVSVGLNLKRSRMLDAEFEAGYRIGFRAGRRVGTPVVVSMDEGRRLGRLSQAPVRSPSGHRAAAGRHAAYQD